MMTSSSSSLEVALDGLPGVQRQLIRVTAAGSEPSVRELITELTHLEERVRQLSGGTGHRSVATQAALVDRQDQVMAELRARALAKGDSIHPPPGDPSRPSTASFVVPGRRRVGLTSPGAPVLVRGGRR